jgi:hypothetical protein
MRLILILIILPLLLLRGYEWELRRQFTKCTNLSPSKERIALTWQLANMVMLFKLPNGITATAHFYQDLRKIRGLSP